MVIHEVIQERRKTLGLTQEQVAEYLGVTTPAVNKWEKGNTCPDIALLPPLARLLKIDLNTLFGFYEDITKQEIILFCKQINEVVLSKGIDAGFALAQEKIWEYPNSDALLHNFAFQLQGLLMTAGLEEEQKEVCLKKIDAWYERLTQSDETVIRNSVHFMLASRAINAGRYDKAQEYLDQMPNRNDTPDKRMLQATIYLEQNQAEEAAKLLEQMLLTAVNDVQMVLCRLMDANIALGDQDTAAYVAERMTKLAENFDLNQYSTAVAPFMLAVRNKDVKQTLMLLRKMFASMASVWKVQESPLYRRIAINATINGADSPLERMLKPMIQELKESKEYEYLWAEKEFQELITEFEEKILTEC